MITKDRRAHRARIKRRIRKKMSGTAERPRLSVYRSLSHIYAQVIDDTTGRTLAAASTLSKDLRDAVKSASSPVERSKLVGQSVAAKARGKKVEIVVFDRNGYRYHGHVKALADAAREAGLKF